MKKILIAILVSLMAIPSMARPPRGHFGPPPRRAPIHAPAFHGGHHHIHSMHTRDWVGVGLAAATIGTVAAIVASEPPPPTVVYTPAPPPVVYAPAPQPVFVQQPVVQTVVVPARTIVRTEVISTTTTVNGVVTGRTTKTRYHYSDGTYEDR